MKRLVIGLGIALCALVALSGCAAGVAVISEPLATPAPPTPVASTPASEVDSIVLTRDIAAGTPADTILASPSSYVGIRSVPSNFRGSSSFESLDELEQLRGLVLTTDLFAGDQLLGRHFEAP